MSLSQPARSPANRNIEPPPRAAPTTPTGDLRNSLRIAQSELKQLGLRSRIDTALAFRGDPEVFLQLLHWILADASPLLASHFANSSTHGRLRAKSDARFLESAWSLLRDQLGLWPPLSRTQFLSFGFAERKMLLIADVARLCRNLLAQLERQTPRKAPLSHIHLSAPTQPLSGIMPPLPSYSVEVNAEMDLTNQSMAVFDAYESDAHVSVMDASAFADTTDQSVFVEPMPQAPPRPHPYPISTHEQQPKIQNNQLPLALTPEPLSSHNTPKPPPNQHEQNNRSVSTPTHTEYVPKHYETSEGDANFQDRIHTLEQTVKSLSDKNSTLEHAISLMQDRLRKMELEISQLKSNQPKRQMSSIQIQTDTIDNTQAARPLSSVTPKIQKAQEAKKSNNSTSFKERSTAEYIRNIQKSIEATRQLLSNSPPTSEPRMR